MKTAQQIGDSFRKQIRNKQKQQIFKSIRSRFQQSEQTNNNTNNNNSNKNVMLEANSHSEMFLKNLTEEIRNDHTNKSCNKIIDSGIHIQLINNLKGPTNLLVTLQLISSILCKQKVKLAHKFVRLGLLEQIVRLIEQINAASSPVTPHQADIINLCMNILSNVIFENVEYAEMMLENFVHRSLFKLAQKVIFAQGSKMQVKALHDTGFNIMWALAALLQIESTLDYKQKFLQILQFTLQIHTLQKYPKIILQIIFLVGYSFREQTQSLCQSAINQLLEQVSPTYPYMETLLIVVKLLSPMDVDYRRVASIVVTVDSTRAIGYGIRILDKCVARDSSIVPKTMEWWERLYLRLVRYEDIEIYIGLLSKCRITSQFVYQILSQILQSHSQHPTLINQTLIYINNLLQQPSSTSSSGPERNKAKFYLKSSGVQNHIEKLYDVSKNSEIVRKCEYLLTVIAGTDGFK